jgi:hypothetical protein
LELGISSSKKLELELFQMEPYFLCKIYINTQVSSVDTRKSLLEPTFHRNSRT